MNDDGYAQRTAILGRLKELLNRQIELFRSYIAVLEKQQAVTAAGGGENILAYIEIENRIAAEIFSVQKVTNPLEDMYCSLLPLSTEDGVSALKAELEELKNRTIAQSEHSRNLLSVRMANVRAEMEVLRSSLSALGARRSLYHGATSLVDIEG